MSGTSHLRRGILFIEEVAENCQPLSYPVAEDPGDTSKIAAGESLELENIDKNEVELIFVNASEPSMRIIKITDCHFIFILFGKLSVCLGGGFFPFSGFGRGLWF